MRFPKKISFLFIIAILGCRQQTDVVISDGVDYSEMTTITVPVDEARVVQMSEVFSDIRYVPLETPAGQYVGAAWKVLFEEDKIFIFTKSSVFIFDEEGGYISNIPIPERGPGGLIQPDDFVVHMDREEVSVLGYLKIARYSFDGEVVDEVMLDHPKPKFGLSLTGDYVLYSGNPINPEVKNNLLHMTLDGEIYKEQLPIQENKRGINAGDFNKFPTYNTKRLFYGYPDLHVFEIGSDTLRARYYLDFGNDGIPEKLYNERSDVTRGGYFTREKMKKGYVGNIYNVHETDVLVYFCFINGRDSRPEEHQVFYSKSHDSSIIASALQNDIDKGYSPPLRINASNGNELVIVTQPYDLIKKAEEIRQTLSEEDLTEYMQREQNLIDLTRNMSPEDNPVLMFMTTKSF